MKNKLGLIFLGYLRVLAKIQTAKINLVRILSGQKRITVVGITGSMGKTSIMLAAAAALKDSFKIKYSSRANSETGIPLDILGLSMRNYSLLDWFRVALLSPIKLITNWKTYDLYLVEMGVDEPDEPKNMSYLLKIIWPRIGVFSGVTSVHSMQFEKAVDPNLSPIRKLKAVKKAIADEKGKMITALPEDGFAILNCDDRLVRQTGKKTKAKVIEIGGGDKPTVKIISTAVSLRGTTFSYQIDSYHPRSQVLMLNRGKRYQLKMKGFVLPKVYGVNFGLAIGVGLALGVDPERAISGIKKHFKMPPGRSSLLRGMKNTLIIDSSYNASPKAVLAMLDLLERLGKRSGRKKLAVLGDMRELGSQSKMEHQKIAKKTAAVADEIVLVGKEMFEYFLPAVVEEGFKKGNIHHFLTAFQAAEFLKKNLHGEELVLVKGSQNTIFLEIVVEA
ncbi:hypothetical protein KKD61_00455, partial [Patescibacteria group bacterium]|nr:hypothetical protein [Patescibacteria group bacterium]